MKASRSRGACGEIVTTVSAPLAITRRVSSAMPSIEARTSAIASRPTSGTMIGGCGAIPTKTNELAWSIVATEGRIKRSLTQIEADKKSILAGGDGSRLWFTYKKRQKSEVRSQRRQVGARQIWRHSLSPVGLGSL